MAHAARRRRSKDCMCLGGWGGVGKKHAPSSRGPSVDSAPNSTARRRGQPAAALPEAAPPSLRQVAGPTLAVGPPYLQARGGACSYCSGAGGPGGSRRSARGPGSGGRCTCSGRRGRAGWEDGKTGSGRLQVGSGVSSGGSEQWGVGMGVGQGAVHAAAPPLPPLLLQLLRLP